ncbi:MAG: SPFH domain-containing protein [Tissierellia bacterium]|nr:SPFH domain-containing protein [Tissierellia bacterium]
MDVNVNNVEEKLITGKKNGALALGIIVILIIASITLFVRSIISLNIEMTSKLISIGGIVLSVIVFIASLIGLFGLRVLNPQEALVLTVFGSYVGTLKGQGFYYVNPFSTSVNPAADTRLGQSGDVSTKRMKINVRTPEGEQSVPVAGNKKISLKAMTLSNSKQKVNDYIGNPIEISIAVVWKVVDTAKAVFNVDNYKEYLSLQCDSAVRNIVKQYPYDLAPNLEIDTTGDGEPDDGSLRGSSEVVARRIRDEIQEKVEFAGIEILEARITHLSYSSEIAAAMLQRQQAAALIDARAMIVDGAVGMVQMALDKLEEGAIVDLDDERKAAMVSNLLVVLCGDKDVSPIINSGSLY